MDWLTIAICIVIAVLALKFLKMVGKVISIVVLVIAVCIFLNSVFSINVVELAQGYLAGM